MRIIELCTKQTFNQSINQSINHCWKSDMWHRQTIGVSRAHKVCQP